MVSVHHRHFEPLPSARQLEFRIRELSDQLSGDYAGKKPLFVIVLNGAFMFAGQLLKQVDVECDLEFVRVSSYHGTASTGTLQQIIGLETEVRDRHVVIIEDIVDTGLTVSRLISQLREKGAGSVEVATLLVKPAALRNPVRIRYAGFEIPDRFVVGYGLDFDGAGRNLNGIFVLKDEPKIN